MNNEVCGIASHLFEQVDTTSIFNQYQDWLRAKTSNPNGEFYKEWKTWLEGINEWFDGVVDESYLTKDNADNYYLNIDNSKTDDFNKGRYNCKFGFSNLIGDRFKIVNNTLKIKDILDYENTGLYDSHNITFSGYVGSLFTALQSFTGDTLDVRVKMKRKSIPQLRLEIWTVNGAERPDVKIGEFKSNSYSNLDSSYTEETFTISMTGNIERGQRLCLIACSNTSTADREINWAYSTSPNTSQDRKYIRSTNSASSWTEYSNRFLWFHIPALAEVPLEGTAIDEITINPDYKWGNLKWSENIPEDGDIKVNILDKNGNLLKENVSPIVDLSHISAIDNPMLKIQYKFIRETPESKSPSVDKVSWTWKGDSKGIELIYSGRATEEDLILNNLNFNKYNLVKIYAWVLIDNRDDEGYFKFNNETVVSREPSTINYGYYLDFLIYNNRIEYGNRTFSKGGDTSTTAHMGDIAGIFKVLINNRTLDIPILDGAKNSIEIASRKGDYNIKIIGYR